jgi:hypothetical protein
MEKWTEISQSKVPLMNARPMLGDLSHNSDESGEQGLKDIRTRNVNNGRGGYNTQPTRR